MNKTKSNLVGVATLLLITILSCNKDEPQNQNSEIQVRFVEQICCGSLLTMKNVLIESSCESYKDSLLAPINFGEFSIFQDIQVNDIITIEYELTENCEAFCDITCNRYNGIPIRILNVEN